MSANSFGKSFLNKTRGTHRTMTSQLVKARKRPDLLTNGFLGQIFFSGFFSFSFSYSFFFFSLLLNNLFLVIYGYESHTVVDHFLIGKEISTYRVSVFFLCSFSSDHLSIYHSILQRRDSLKLQIERHWGSLRHLC